MTIRLPPLLLVLAAAWGLVFAAQSAFAQADLYGDTLPAGARARFGTLRFRANTGSSLRFLPDGKTLALGNSDTISLMDLQLGTVRKRRLCAERVRTLAYSQGGQYVAAHVVDKTGTGNDGNKICLWDASTGTLLHTIPLPDPKHLPRVLAVSRDGKLLALGGNDPVIRLLDAATGNERWRIASQIPWRGVSNRCLAFSPDGTLLVGPSEKDSSLCLWDVATGQKRRELCNCTTAYCVTFSADGKTLAATAETRAQQKWARLHLWDVATGRALPLPEQQAGAVFEAAFSPDGTLLAASSASNTHQVMWGPLDIGLWNVATGKKLRQWRGGWNLVFSPDGAAVLSSYGAAVYVHEAATGRELKQEFVGHQSALWSVAFSPDGKTLVTEDRYETRNTWEVATSRRTDHGPSRLTRGNRWIHSADGKLLAWMEHEWDGVIRVCEADTGKELRVIKADPKRLGGISLAFSPDGKLLAGAGYRKPAALCLWAVATGKEMAIAPEPPGNGYYGLSFSPDGKLLALGCHDGTVRLWDFVNGKEQRRFGESTPADPDALIVALAFSADGKSVAASNLRAIRIWEVVTSKERRLLPASASCLAFAPNGLTLASGSTDTTALLWDNTGALRESRKAKPLSAPDLASLWSDLAGDDGAAAYRALGILCGAPAQSIPYLAERMRPAVLDEEKIARKIAELDSNQFLLRAKAIRALEEMGDRAELALRKASASHPSWEVRRRAQALLEKIDLGLLAGERLRAWRAIEALEAMATPAAKRVLEKLAQGAQRDRLTREAQAALQRLHARIAATRP